jgi:predicted Zn-dependent protease
MQPDSAKKLVNWLQDLFGQELVKLKIVLQQGLPIKEYQILDAAHQALVKTLVILETFSRESDKYCSDPSVIQCLELIQHRNENNWVNLPENELLQKLMAATGFLAADMGLQDEAESLFRILAQQYPDNVNPMLGLAYAKLLAGSAKEALEVIRNKVLNMAPGNDLGLAFLALTYNSLRKTDEALAAASAVIAANRDDAAVALALEIQRSLGHPAS